MNNETLVFLSVFFSGISLGVVACNLIWMFLTNPK